MPNSDPIELVIFDCDGVLVDSERLVVKMEVEMFAEMGLQLTVDDIVRDFVGRSDEFVRAEVGRRLGRELAPDWDAAYSDRYREILERDLEAVDGIVDALDAITLPTCVASSGSHTKMGLTLGKTGLYSRFEGRIFSASEVERGKPFPDLFLHAAASMNAEPSRCAVVEDSAPGVEAAIAAGMRVFAYGGGVTPRERLARDGATVFIDMRELPALIEATSSAVPGQA